jgi:hypothetical protein
MNICRNRKETKEGREVGGRGGGEAFS